MKKTVEHTSATLSYYVYGKGLPLILIHGFAETNSIWKKQSGYLKKYCRVIVPDLPGSGESSTLSSEQDGITIDALAESVHSIIKNENIQECVMLGHSMGGYVTLAFAEKYPDKLKGFGLINSTAFADTGEKRQIRMKAIKLMETRGSFVFLKTSIPGLFAKKFKTNHAKEISNFIEKGKLFNKRNLQQYYHAMMQRKEKTNVLRSTPLPVLFVMGEEDTAAPLNDVLKQVHLPEISYIHAIEKTGHMSMWEAAGKLNRIMKDFLHAFN